jgi:hypothetical protein
MAPQDHADGDGEQHGTNASGATDGGSGGDILRVHGPYASHLAGQDVIHSKVASQGAAGVELLLLHHVNAWPCIDYAHIHSSSFRDMEGTQLCWEQRIGRILCS